MKSSRRAEDDEKRDQIRKTHSQVGIPANAAQVLSRHRFRVRRQVTAAIAGRDGLEVLDFLGRLPEKEVRADRGAQHGHQHRDGVVVESKLREKSAPNDLVPRHMDRENHRHIGEKAQRQPFQVTHVGLIPQVDLQRQAGDAEEY